MTNPDYVHYVLIIDRSGSMRTIREDAEGGIRQFIRDQMALPVQSTLSLYQFDGEHELVHDFARLEEARDYTLIPRGSTALLDAVGFAVAGTGEALAAMPEDDRPGRVYMLIATDGKENVSKEFGGADGKARIREMLIHQQEKYGWQITYLGANVDAFAEASGIGLSASSSLEYAATSAGTSEAYASASAAVTRSVLTASPIAYTEAERKRAGGGKLP